MIKVFYNFRRKASSPFILQSSAVALFWYVQLPVHLDRENLYLRYSRIEPIKTFDKPPNSICNSPIPLLPESCLINSLIRYTYPEDKKYMYTKNPFLKSSFIRETGHPDLFHSFLLVQIFLNSANILVMLV